MRVLIVDDEPDICDLVSDMLDFPHIEDKASNGVEAVTAVKVALRGNTPYDLVILDVSMPKMNGHEALREIRRIEEEHGIDLGDGVKVMMLTAYGDSKTVFDSFFRNHCDGFVTKPFNADDIRKCMRKMSLL